MKIIKRNLQKLNSYLDSSDSGRIIKKKLKYLFQEVMREKAYWWHSKALEKNLKAFRKDPRSKIKIIFLIHLPSSWTALKSVYEACLKDPTVEPILVLTPRRTNRFSDKWEGLEESEAYFKSQNISYTLSCNKDYSQWLDLKDLNPDVIFIQTPYEDQRHPLYKIGRLSKFTRVCYIPYAFILTAGSFEEEFYGTFFHKDCWKIFAESEYHKQKFAKFCSEKNIVVTGYPKFDAYKDVKNIDRSFGKTIIWAAHWTIQDEHFNASTFLKNYHFFLKFAQENPEIRIVFRPHPFLYKALVQGGHFSQSQLDEFVKLWSSFANTETDTSPNYFETFFDSNLLITDNGSFLGEYLPTENPIIYTHNYTNNEFNLSEYGVGLTKYHYIAKTVDELNDLVKEIIINNNDYLKKDRLQNSQKFLFSTGEKSGDLIVRSIVNEFNGKA